MTSAPSPDATLRPAEEIPRPRVLELLRGILSGLSGHDA